MPDARPASGSLTALNGVVDIPCAGFKFTGVRLSGTWSGTVTFRGSVDGRGYDTLTVKTFDGSTTATTATSAGEWRVACSGLTVVRCAMTSFSSGSAQVDMLASAD